MSNQTNDKPPKAPKDTPAPAPDQKENVVITRKPNGLVVTNYVAKEAS